MAAGVATSAFSSQLFKKDLRRIFIEVGEEYPPEYTEFMNVADMETNPEKEAQYSGMGTMPAKPEGEQFTLDKPLPGGNVTYTATSYGLGFEVTYENWRDDLYRYWPEMTAELARSARNRQEVNAFALLNGAFGTTFTGFNGVQLCSTAQTPIANSGLGNFANRPSPDVGFSITGIQNMILRFRGMKDERGFPRRLKPAMLLIDPANQFAAREILGSGGKPFTADNEINSLVADMNTYMVCTYFTSPTQWFALARKGEHDLNFRWRDRPIFDSADDHRTKSAFFSAYEALAVGFGSWRGVDGTAGV